MELANEYMKMSFVTDIFVTDQRVIVVYNKASNDKNLDNKTYMMQFYDLKGKSLEEVTLPKGVGKQMFFDKKQNLIYSLSNSAKDNGDESYSILKIQISD
jgi:sugar lactone lactonase YvrE